MCAHSLHASDFTAVFTWITVTFWTGGTWGGRRTSSPFDMLTSEPSGWHFQCTPQHGPADDSEWNEWWRRGKLQESNREAAWSHRAPCCHQPAPLFSYNMELLMCSLLGFTVISRPRYVKKLPKPTVCLFCTSHAVLPVWSSLLPPGSRCLFS